MADVSVLLCECVCGRVCELPLRSLRSARGSLWRCSKRGCGRSPARRTPVGSELQIGAISSNSLRFSITFTLGDHCNLNRGHDGDMFALGKRLVERNMQPTPRPLLWTLGVAKKHEERKQMTDETCMTIKYLQKKFLFRRL